MRTRIPALAAASVLVLSIAACKVDGTVECSPATQSCHVDVTRVPDGTTTTTVKPTTTTTAPTTTTTTTTVPTDPPGGEG
jgi:predicted small lipoprotein YifL